MLFLHDLHALCRLRVVMLSIMSLLPSYIHTQKQICTCYVRLVVIMKWEVCYNDDRIFASHCDNMVIFLTL